MPDTYRKLFEDMLAHIDVLDHDPFVDRLRALDEAGPYGWAVEVNDERYVRSDQVFRERATAARYSTYFTNRGEAAVLRPLYAGTPEEVDDASE